MNRKTTLSLSALIFLLIAALMIWYFKVSRDISRKFHELSEPAQHIGDTATAH